MILKFKIFWKYNIRNTFLIDNSLAESYHRRVSCRFNYAKIQQFGDITGQNSDL